MAKVNEQRIKQQEAERIFFRFSKLQAKLVSHVGKVVCEQPTTLAI